MTRGAHVRVLVLPEYRGWKPYPGSAEGGLDSIGIGTPELREGAGGWEVGGEPVEGGLLKLTLLSFCDVDGATVQRRD